MQPLSPNDPEFEKALLKALRMVHASDKLSAEVKQALIRSGVNEETSGRVLALLSERRVLDDQKTILKAVERALGRRGLGKEKIRASLIARGAPEEMVEACLAQHNESDELERMLELLRSRADKNTRAKAGRFLASRGFGEESVEDALNAFFGDSETG